MTDRHYLKKMADYSNDIEHSSDCGQCEHKKVAAETAKYFLDKNEIVNMAVYWKEVARRWYETDFYKHWLTQTHKNS